MRFSSRPSELTLQIQGVINQCEVSRNQRSQLYREVRAGVLYGTDTGEYSRFNKIYHNIRLKSSFLYSSRTVRFGLSPPPGSAPEMAERCEVAAQHLTRRFRESGMARMLAQQVFWGLAYGSMLIKLGWSGGLKSWLVEPSQFGVLHEENPILSDQEAASLRFFSSKNEVERALLAAGKTATQVKNLMKNVSTVQGEKMPESESGFLGRLIISQVNPTYAGAVPNMTRPTTSAMRPKSDEELVEMRELRVYDDDLKDYRVFTVALPNVVIFDRPSADLDISGEYPFVNLTPNPLYDYFWGVSEGQQLLPLQKWREKRMDQLDTLFARQIKPPGILKNVTGITSEKWAAAWRQGNLISTGSAPNASIEPQFPQMPPESFAEINAIDSMFDATLGVPPVLQGQNPIGGAKGESGMSVMVQMASAPIINQALEVEAAVEKAGDLAFRLLRRYDKTVLKTNDGTAFTTGLLPDGCSVTVSSHSSSPIFSSDIRAEAAQMLEGGLIDGETYFELTDPPLQDTLIERFRTRQAKEQNQHQQVIAALTQALLQTPPAERATILANFVEGTKTRVSGKK